MRTYITTKGGNREIRQIPQRIFLEMQRMVSSFTAIQCFRFGTAGEYSTGVLKYSIEIGNWRVFLIFTDKPNPQSIEKMEWLGGEWPFGLCGASH